MVKWLLGQTPSTGTAWCHTLCTCESVCVSVRAPVNVFFRRGSSDSAATLTRLYWQVPYANKWPRPAGSVKGDVVSGCIRPGSDGQSRFRGESLFHFTCTQTLHVLWYIYSTRVQPQTRRRWLLACSVFKLFGVNCLCALTLAQKHVVNFFFFFFFPEGQLNNRQVRLYPGNSFSLIKRLQSG